MLGTTEPAVPRIVCIGGGYCALILVKALRRAVRRGDVELVIVSRTNFHAFHGFVGEMLSGRIQPQAILSPARRVFRPACFMNAEVTAIDLDEQQLTISRLLDGREQVLGYDHLVVSVGVADDVDGYPGLREHGLLLRDYRDAWHTRNHLLQMMEMAANRTRPGRTPAAADGGRGRRRVRRGRGRHRARRVGQPVVP